jgi:predicted Zn-dependent peptidase
VVNKDLEQVHICLGTQGPSAVDPGRHAGYILNAILGGGMSSRLFQEVREKSGLAYSVYSFLTSFSNAGLFGIYAGCDRDRARELVRIVSNETNHLSTTITDDDIRTAKNQIKGNIILAMESTETRMNRLAKGEFYFGRHLPLTEIMEALDNVTPDDLSRTAGKMINSGHFTSIALGPLDEDENLFRAFG